MGKFTTKRPLSDAYRAHPQSRTTQCSSVSLRRCSMLSFFIGTFRVALKGAQTDSKMHYIIESNNMLLLFAIGSTNGDINKEAI